VSRLDDAFAAVEPVRRESSIRPRSGAGRVRGYVIARGCGICRRAGYRVEDQSTLYHLTDYPIPVSVPGFATQLESRISRGCRHS